MSIEAYIRALPKVELNLQFEGAVPKETMLMFADQNDKKFEIKRFDNWVKQYKKPDFKKLDDLTDMLRSWIKYDDDLARAVYDIGVMLSKDNVRYAEVSINPLSFVSNDFTFDAFINALNDGRDRVERAWGVQMRWVMVIPRNDARRADEVARWATSATGKRGGIVGITLAGYNQAVSIDQFERTFNIAQKKDIARSAHLSPQDDIDEAVALLDLDMVVDAWGLIESPETMTAMSSSDICLNIGLAKSLAYGWVNKLEKVPLKELMDAGLKVAIGTDMPVIFETSLSDEYLSLINEGLATVEDIEAMIQTTLELSHLAEEEIETLQAIFMMESDVLKAEHFEVTSDE